MDAIYQAICRIGIFMICAQALIHFRPKESYEKYLKLLVSAMVLTQMLLPVGSLLLGKGGQGAADMLGDIQEQLEQAMEEASRNAAEADAVLEKMTLEEVRKLLEEQGGDTQEEPAREEGTGEEPGEAHMGGEKLPEGKREGADADGKDPTALRIEPVEPVSVAPILGETDGQASDEQTPENGTAP